MVRAEGADTPPITVNLTVKCPFVFTPSLSGSNQNEKVKKLFRKQICCKDMASQSVPMFSLANGIQTENSGLVR